MRRYPEEKAIHRDDSGSDVGFVRQQMDGLGALGRERAHTKTRSPAARVKVPMRMLQPEKTRLLMNFPWEMQVCVKSRLNDSERKPTQHP